MANQRGRPVSPLLLSAEEHDYLQRQVRRHRAPRSLSERCRIILRCSAGLSNKAVAGELGCHEHTVGRWRRRFQKDRIDGLLDQPRPGRPRSIEDDRVAEVIRADASRQAEGRHALVDPLDGPGGGLFSYDDPPYLDGLRPSTPSRRAFQALERPPVRRQGSRHCWLVSLTTQPGFGLERR